MKSEDVKLGAEYRDRVTGFKGICIGKTDWLNGCATVGLKAKVDKEGKEREALWVDVQQIEFVKNVLNEGSKATGGPKPTPSRNLRPG